MSALGAMTQRTRFQGVGNIVRFNWPLFVASAALLCVGVLITPCAWLALPGLIVPLLVSHWIYDRSPLYRLDWLEARQPVTTAAVFHAGFDEVSALLRQRFPEAILHTFDFFDPLRHTEPSIRRARRACPPFPGTVAIDSRESLPLAAASLDLAVFFLSAHEIRDDGERARFFAEARRVLAPAGSLYVIEHLRDLPNALAYTLGVFHFLGAKTWSQTFAGAHLHIKRSFKITPFIMVWELSAG